MTALLVAEKQRNTAEQTIALSDKDMASETEAPIEVREATTSEEVHVEATGIALRAGDSERASSMQEAATAPDTSLGHPLTEGKLAE